MPELEKEIATYEAMRPGLEAQYTGKWVLIHGDQFIGTYESFEKAAEDAVARFGRGPFLVRQVGAPPLTLPASVMYNPVHAGNKLRI